MLPGGRQAALAVLDGVAGRLETLALLRKQLEAQPPDSYSDFAGGIAGTMLDLYPDVCRDALTSALQRGGVSEWSFDERDIETALGRGEQGALDGLREKLHRQLPDNGHDHLEWWACFEPRPEPPKARPAPGSGGGRVAKARQRKRMAKQSKRKNRKKRKRK